MKTKSHSVKTDFAHMISILARSKDLNVNVSLNDDVSRAVNESFSFLSMKESSDLYIPGTSQSMTWIVHYLSNGKNRNLAAWPCGKQNGRKGQDIGALAPTNLSPSRIITLYEANLKSRMSLRFRTMLNINGSDFENIQHNMDVLQYAAVVCVPSLITEAENHRSYWVNYQEDDFNYSGQDRWFDLQVIVAYGDSFNRKSEIWNL